MKNFKNKIQKIMQEILDDESFGRVGTSGIAYYFRDALQEAGYTMTDKNWGKTKDAAIQISNDPVLKNLSFDDWCDCIDWCFSSDRYADAFWKRVSILNLATVLKARNSFVQWQQRNRAEQASNTAKKLNRINYGRIRS